MPGMYGMYYFDWTYILVIIGAAFSMLASGYVKNTFRKYSKYRASCGMTSDDVARKLLNDNGCHGVRIERIRGELTDNYDPRTQVLHLSDTVYGSQSIASIAVAAHECGHAMQHNESYAPLTLRSSFVKVANLGSNAGIPILILGLFLSMQPFITLGVILFSFGFLFQVITLPVEFNASKRALEQLEELGILQGEENAGARKVLTAAALTYVASAAASLLSLLRIILIARGGRRRD